MAFEFSVELRLAVAKDAAAINDIYNLAVATRRATADLAPLLLARRKAWLEAHPPERFPVFVATHKGKVVGWSSLSSYRNDRPALRRTIEVSYYVHPEAHRRGVATKLLDHTLKEATRLGYRTAIAILLEINQPSIKMLEGFGFERWGMMPDIAELGTITCGHVYYGRHLHMDECDNPSP